MLRDMLPSSASVEWTSNPCAGLTYDRKIQQDNEKKDVRCESGHSLFQELFFFCKVKNVGDIPGTGSIYVETVVDRDSGIAVAKVYSAKNAINAVDILASRVLPFFKHQGVAIREIHTRKTSEYSGFPFVHPFEQFLATAHIQHLPKVQLAHPDNYLCEQFYRFLLKEIFLSALRRNYQLSLSNLQEELDKFVKGYNAGRLKDSFFAKQSHPSICEFPC